MTTEVAILAFFAFICLLITISACFNYWVTAKKYIKALEMSYDYSDKLLETLKIYTKPQSKEAFVTGLTVVGEDDSDVRLPKTESSHHD